MIEVKLLPRDGSRAWRMLAENGRGPRLCSVHHQSKPSDARRSATWPEVCTRALADKLLFISASQRSAGMDHDRWFTRVMVMLCDGVHGVRCSGAFLMNALDRAVTNGATIMPCHG